MYIVSLLLLRWLYTLRSSYVHTDLWDRPLHWMKTCAKCLLKLPYCHCFDFLKFEPFSAICRFVNLIVKFKIFVLLILCNLRNSTFSKMLSNKNWKRFRFHYLMFFFSIWIQTMMISSSDDQLLQIKRKFFPSSNINKKTEYMHRISRPQIRWNDKTICTHNEIGSLFFWHIEFRL